MQALLAVARGDAEADLVLSGGRLVNVFSGEIYLAEVAVFGGRIAGELGHETFVECHVKKSRGVIKGSLPAAAAPRVPACAGSRGKGWRSARTASALPAAPADPFRTAMAPAGGLIAAGGMPPQDGVTRDSRDSSRNRQVEHLRFVLKRTAMIGPFARGID